MVALQRIPVDISFRWFVSCWNASGEDPWIFSAQQQRSQRTCVANRRSKLGQAFPIIGTAGARLSEEALLEPRKRTGSFVCSCTDAVRAAFHPAQHSANSARCGNTLDGWPVDEFSLESPGPEGTPLAGSLNMP